MSKLTIVIPVYNGAAYIENLIQQLETQQKRLSMQPDSASINLECVFVDDGSTDDSLQRIRGYEKLSWVTVLCQDNRGVSAARNSAIRYAIKEQNRDNYITFIDVDDALQPDYLTAIGQMIRANATDSHHSYDVIYFCSQRVRETDLPLDISSYWSIEDLSCKKDVSRQKDISPPKDSSLQNKLCLKSITQEEMFCRILRNPTAFGVYNLLLRADYVQNQQLLFTEGYKYYEDYDYILRVFAHTEAIGYSDKILYNYVQRNGSAVGKFRSERIANLSLIRQCCNTITEKNDRLQDTYSNCLIARLYWSVLWQSVFALPGYRHFQKFAEHTYADIYMRCAARHADSKVRLSSLLYNRAPFLYYMAVRLSGRGHSRIGVLQGEDLQSVMRIKGDNPERILLYGMTHNPGGIESYVIGLVERQKEGTFDFLCDFPSIAYEDRLRAKGSRIHFIPAKGKHLAGHLQGVWKTLKDHPEYHTIYMNVLDAGCLVTSIPVKLLGRRLIVHSHNSDTDKNRLHRICKKWLSFLADGAAACSKTAAEYMFTPKRAAETLLIPNVIDTKRFRFDAAKRQETREALGIRADQKVLLHVGRLTRQKNPMFLLDMMSELHRIDSSWMLLSVGTGDMEEQFLHQIRKLRLQEVIKPLGVVDYVSALMQAADAFVLPSLYEGFPIVGIEAQTADLYCFFSDQITQDTRLTEKALYLPLSAGAEFWAQRISETIKGENQNIERHSEQAEKIIDAGYDQSSAKIYDRQLMNLLRGRG